LKVNKVQKRLHRLWARVGQGNKNTKQDESTRLQSTNLGQAPTVNDEIDLETEEDVLNWLRHVVTDKPKTPAVTDVSH
jgi:hypothetical protein